jgi:hypothetical protein
MLMWEFCLPEELRAAGVSVNTLLGLLRDENAWVATGTLR